MNSSRTFVARGLVALCLLSSSGVVGCAAVFPQYTTSARDIPAALREQGGFTPPPDTLHHLGMVSAECPRLTRDGRPWDGDGAPDLYVVFLRNGEEVFRSRTVNNSFTPTWSLPTDAIDLFVRNSDVFRVELRDDDGPLAPADFVGMTEVRDGVPSEARDSSQWTLRLEGGATVVLSSHPPEPRIGMGVTFEYRIDYVSLVSVAEAGPANTAGLRAGDRVVRINGTAVSAMSELQVRQAFDRVMMQDLTVAVERSGSAAFEATVRSDALYNGR
ncbi:MAG: PDZ domain-containing protein [Polyangiales bacterium]